MNERIKDILKQATQYADSLGPIDGAEWCNAEYSKFAELIVRECINIAYEYDKPKLSGPGLAIASNIESHFDIYIEEDGRFVK
jgi:hypothetical protein